VLAYLPSLSHGFVRDDHELIEGNGFLRAPQMLMQLLTTDFWESAGGTSGLWRPLVTLSYWIDVRVGGGNAAWPHAMNVVAHAATTALLAGVLLLARLPCVAVAIAAAWFAVMPVNVEAVSWIAGRTDVLCAQFALLTVALDRIARARGRADPGPAAAAALAAALLCKEAAAGWAVVMAVAVLVEPQGRPATFRSLARWLAPYAIVIVAWLAAHWALAGSRSPPDLDASRVARQAAAGWTLVPHAAAFLWPGYPHTPDAAPIRIATPWAWPALAGAAVTLASWALLPVLVARRSRAAVPLTLFLVPLVPVVIVMLASGRPVFGERVVYLPSTGAAWLLALLVARAGAGWKRRMVIAAGVALVGASAAACVYYQAAWRDDHAMYQRMVATQPANPLGHLGLAEMLARGGERAAAERELAAGLTLDPGRPEPYLTRAALHYRYGEWLAVEEAATRALVLDPNLFAARELRATARLRLRRIAGAEEDAAEMLRESPGHPAALAVQGQLWLLEGRFDEAAVALARATRWRPDDPAVWYALGSARVGVGDLEGARAATVRTVALDPAFYEGWLRLAGLLG